MTTTAPMTNYTRYTDPKAVGSSAPPAKKNSGGAMSENDFLSLLTTQLQHQDPLNPEKDTDFAAQMAQYSALGQMTKLNDTMNKQNSMMSMLAAANLVGRTVTTTVAGAQGTPVSGVVSSVMLAPDGSVTYKVGDATVAADKITGILMPITPQTGVQATPGAASVMPPAATAASLAIAPSTATLPSAGSGANPLGISPTQLANLIADAKAQAAQRVMALPVTAPSTAASTQANAAPVSADDSSDATLDKVAGADKATL